VVDIGKLITNRKCDVFLSHEDSVFWQESAIKIYGSLVNSEHQNISNVSPVVAHK